MSSGGPSAAAAMMLGPIPNPNTVANVAVETDVAVIAVPANQFRAGDAFRWVATGWIKNNTAGAQNMRIRNRYGGLLNADSGIIAFPNTAQVYDLILETEGMFTAGGGLVQAIRGWIGVPAAANEAFDTAKSFQFQDVGSYALADLNAALNWRITCTPGVADPNLLVSINACYAARLR